MDSFLTMFQRFSPLLIHYFIKMSVIIADVGVFVHAYGVFLIAVDAHCEFVVFYLPGIRLQFHTVVSLS